MSDCILQDHKWRDSCSMVYQDEKVLAFRDINPLCSGSCIGCTKAAR